MGGGGNLRVPVAGSGEGREPQWPRLAPSGWTQTQLWLYGSILQSENAVCPDCHTAVAQSTLAPGSDTATGSAVVVAMASSQILHVRSHIARTSTQCDWKRDGGEAQAIRRGDRQS